MSGVTRRTTLELLTRDGELVPVPVKLRWSTDAPYTVSLAMEQGCDQWLTWLLSRDLLADGLHHAPAGLGDISFLPDFDHPGHLEMVLSSTDTWKVPEQLDGYRGTSLRVPRRPLREFLNRTWQLVPAGEEVMPSSWLRGAVA